jgi:RNA polymerase sigma-70 factor (ECF subfamily)
MQAVLETEAVNRAAHRDAAAGPRVDADQALVAAARRGEAAAYKELMTRYESRLFRLAYRITRNHEDAEEVTQDAFARAFSRLDTFQGDSRFSTWLTRIAVNQALMLLRQRRPDAVPLDELVETEDGSLPRQIVDWGPNPEQRFAQEELSAILDDAIAGLKTDQQVVFQLRDVEELSIEETAALLGISVPAVKTRLLRARLALREKLNRYFRPPVGAVQPAWAAAGSK